MEELNSCPKDFYVSCRKKDSGYYKKTWIMAIRAAIDRFLRVEHNKPFSIVGNPANLVLDSFVKDLRKTGKIGRIVHKKSITEDQLQHLFETGELGQADSMDPSQLQKTVWFYVSLTKEDAKINATDACSEKNSHWKRVL